MRFGYLCMQSRSFMIWNLTVMWLCAHRYPIGQLLITEVPRIETRVLPANSFIQDS